MVAIVFWSCTSTQDWELSGEEGVPSTSSQRDKDNLHLYPAQLPPSHGEKWGHGKQHTNALQPHTMGHYTELPREGV